MNVGIDINITAGSLKINRCSYLEVNYIHGAIINTANFVITDIDGDIFSSLKKDDNVVIEFSSDGESAKFSGTIQKIDAYYNRNSLKVSVLSEAKKLCTTFINESYNDESTNNIIKRLVQNAGFDIGEINLPDITIPHIVFNNVTVATAINNIYKTIIDLGYDLSGQDYFINNGKFYAGDTEISGNIPLIETGINIIHHDFSKTGYAEIECSLIPALTNNMMFKLNDTIRNISGKFRAEFVKHIIDRGKARTIVGYYME